MGRLALGGGVGGQVTVITMHESQVDPNHKVTQAEWLGRCIKSHNQSYHRQLPSSLQCTREMDTPIVVLGILPTRKMRRELQISLPVRKTIPRIKYGETLSASTSDATKNIGNRTTRKLWVVSVRIWRSLDRSLRRMIAGYIPLGKASSHTFFVSSKNVFCI